ncbi:MAG TPA: zinc-ribbon domain-containing protein [Planctomicrobium sp.]|nr:zinc-ribbon domain-containing protein [Planctomicrobium sp.]
MTRYDEADDWDQWDEEYPDEPDESGTVECPNCGTDVYEDAPSCPVCGEYLVTGSRTGPAWQGKPMWYVTLAMIGIFAVIAALLIR